MCMCVCLKKKKTQISCEYTTENLSFIKYISTNDSVANLCRLAVDFNQLKQQCLQTQMYCLGQNTVHI